MIIDSPKRRPKRKTTNITNELVSKIQDLYDKGMGQVKVAKELDISPTTVRRIFSLYNLKARPQGESLRVYMKQNKGMMCGDKCHGWKGGRSIDGSGYYLITIPPDDPHIGMMQKKGYVMEHRYIMAKHLGRDLKSWEIVHHKNGDRKDNCIDNLQLLNDSSDHGKYTMGSHNLVKQVKKLETQITELQKRVTILEIENVMLKMERCIS